MQSLIHLMTQLMSHFNSIDKYLQDCESSLNLDFEGKLQELSLNSESVSEVQNGIKESYRQTFANLAKISKSKMKHLKSMII